MFFGTMQKDLISSGTKYTTYQDKVVKVSG